MNKKVILAVVLALLFFQKNSFSQDTTFNSRFNEPAFQDSIVQFWHFYKPMIQEQIDKSAFDTYKLYNVQITTNILLKYAFNQKNYNLVDDLLKMYLEALNTIDTVEKIRFYFFYPVSKPQDTVLNLNKKYLIWLDGINNDNPAAEDILSSSQFLDLISEAVFKIAKMSASTRSVTMIDFVKQYTPILESHYDRWIRGVDVRNPISNEEFKNVGPFQRRGWACKVNNNYIPTHMTHQKLIEDLLINNCGDDKSVSYCNAVLDVDLWIISGVSNLVAAYLTDSILIGNLKNLDFYQKRYLPIANYLIMSRITLTNLKDFDGKNVNGYIFDKGKFDDHFDYSYAGYTNADKYPSTNDAQSVKGIAWDISHARRFVNVFQTLYETKDILGFYFPDSTDMSFLANQFIYKVFNQDFNYPLFSNYYNGTNGWYRVAYAKRLNYGYGPSDLSTSAYTGGYCLWKEFNPDMQIVTNSMYKMLHSQNPSVKEHFNHYYERYCYTNDSLTNLPTRQQVYFFKFDSIPEMNTQTLYFLLNFYSSVNPLNINENISKRNQNVIVTQDKTNNILFISSRSMILEVNILDQSGEKIVSLQDKALFFKADISTIIRGIYVLIIRTQDDLIIQKFEKK